MPSPFDAKKILRDCDIEQPLPSSEFAAKGKIDLDEDELGFCDFGARLHRLRATADEITEGRYALRPIWRPDGTRSGYTVYCDTDALCVLIALSM